MPQIKPVLLDEWNKIPKIHQKLMMDPLKNGGYEIKQQELLLRELYSYFLQYNAKNYLKTIKVLNPMSELVDLYAPKIKNSLENIKVKIITLH